MRIHDRVWIADNGFIETMVRKILEINGDIGIIIKFAFFSGLRGEEITYAFDTSICANLSGCNCSNIHLMKKSDYVIIVLDRIVGQKHSYFTILPAKIWDKFKILEKVTKEERNIAHILIKNHTENKATLMDLRKFHYNILCRSEMSEQGAEVLAGRVKSVSAKHYLIHELDKMLKQYADCMMRFLSVS